MLVFRKEAETIRKLKKYILTKFKAKDSVYSKTAADYAVGFIECLTHTKGTWAGKNFELIDWQEQIIRDILGILKPNGYRQFTNAYRRRWKNLNLPLLWRYCSPVAIIRKVPKYTAALTSTTDITAFVLVFPPEDEDDK